MAVHTLKLPALVSGTPARRALFTLTLTLTPGDSQDTYEKRYEQLMEQFGQDVGIYVRAVCETIVITVPKTVVHCMIKRTQTVLLDKLFTHVHQLTEPQIKSVLQEDPAIVNKRNAARCGARAGAGLATGWVHRLWL